MLVIHKEGGGPALEESQLKSVHSSGSLSFSCFTCWKRFSTSQCGSEELGSQIQNTRVDYRSRVHLLTDLLTPVKFCH